MPKEYEVRLKEAQSTVEKAQLNIQNIEKLIYNIESIPNHIDDPESVAQEIKKEGEFLLQYIPSNICTLLLTEDISVSRPLVEIEAVKSKKRLTWGLRAVDEYAAGIADIINTKYTRHFTD